METRTTLFYESSLTRVWQHAAKAGHQQFGVISAHRRPADDATPEQLKAHKKEMASRHKQLKADVRKAGYGHFELEGHWQECPSMAPDQFHQVTGSCPNGWNFKGNRCVKVDPGAKDKFSPPYKDCPKHLLRHTTEPTLFVPKASKDFIQKMAEKYEQDGGLHADADTDEVHLVQADGEHFGIGPFHPNSIAQGWSMLKKGPQGRKQRVKGPQEPAEVAANRTFTFAPPEAVLPESVFEGFSYQPRTFLEAMISLAH